MQKPRRGTLTVLVASWLAAGPLPCSARPVTSVISEVPAATIVAAGERPFGTAAIARAVEAELAASAAPTTQPPVQTTAPAKRDSVWNGVLIGAGTGAVIGGVWAASDDCGSDTDYGGGCAMLAGPAIGAGIIVGALIGAGAGAVVDLLIK